MKKVLVVEDNENNMYLITFILKKSGYEVFEAKTGEQGVELASQERFDMVLMDIQLPGIDGYETTRRIRELQGNSDILIIAVTSYAMSGDREQAIEAGCDGYIEKPINPETIVDEIERYFQSRSQK